MRPHRPTEDYVMKSGWRYTALVLAMLVAVLTVFLTSILFVSLHRLGNGWAAIMDNSAFFVGSCEISSRLNTFLHFLINMVSSGILASSNFFMQVLCAPTRDDINKAHRKRYPLEIGVQSWKNLWRIPIVNVLMWLAFAGSSVPFHIVFNSCVVESKTSTNAVLVQATESFLNHGPYDEFGVGALLRSNKPAYWKGGWESYYPSHLIRLTLDDMAPRVSEWEKLDLENCVKWYDDVNAVLTAHRHVIMILEDNNDASLREWTVSVRRNPEEMMPFNTTYLNSIWRIYGLWRTDKLQTARANDIRAGGYGENTLITKADWANSFKAFMDLDPITGILKMDNRTFLEPYQTMRVSYCMSEPYPARCKLEISNILLLVVCSAVFLKSILCSLTISHFRSDKSLITLGDAIASFIERPDPTTELMCTLSKGSFGRSIKRSSSNRTWPETARIWKKTRRRYGNAVPLCIWIFSYILIVASLVFAALLFYQALLAQDM
jgi:hypothetical protein